MGGIKTTFHNLKKRIKNDSIVEITPVTPEKQVMMFDAVNLDTNNTCNQRCRFCFTDFNESKTNMDIETFKCVLKILPYVKDYAGGGYGFYFSCIYEPTINPNFLEYLSLLPSIAKNKCFITTNLAIPMTKEFITKMISSNVHLINVSIESLDEDKFEYITQNKKFNTYKNNLQLLEEAINGNNDNPKFRFITILLKENKNEIIDLIKYTHNHFPLESHEVRTPYINYYENMEWNKKQYMTKSETQDIINQIQSLDYPVDMIIDSVEDLECLNETNEVQSEYNQQDDDIYTEASKNLKEVEDHEYLFLRITPYGTCIDKRTNEPEEIPLNNTENYFKQKLFDLYKNKADVAYCQKFEDKEEILGSSFIMMDKLVENDAILELNGWCCPDRKVNINKLIVRFTGMDGDIHYCHASTKTRPDADAFKQKEEGWCGGYATYIAKSKLESENYMIDFLYKDYAENTICYRWQHSIKLN